MFCFGDLQQCLLLVFCLLFIISVIVCAPSANMFVTAFVILPLSVWVPVLAQPGTPFCNGQKSSAQALAVSVAAYVEPILVMPKGKDLWQVQVFILNAYTGSLLTKAN